MKTTDEKLNFYLEFIDEQYRSTFQIGWRKCLEYTDKWIDCNVEPIPKDGKEYLTKNDRQGGVLRLISWNTINKHYQDKGEYVHEPNAGTHWKPTSFL